ncbi:MAG: hypothetical protein HFJ30_07135 [Clostridia bacterium]|nr:hypothetical protein [Clostridia bacterium]
MDYACVALLGVIAGILIKKSFENKRNLELTQENTDLQIWKAEHLDTVEKNIELNRTQRNIRNIITEGRKRDEIHTFILQKIEKELSMNC